MDECLDGVSLISLHGNHVVNEENPGPHIIYRLVAD